MIIYDLAQLLDDKNRLIEQERYPEVELVGDFVREKVKRL